MPRVLYGYRQTQGRALISEAEASVVRAVLGARPGSRIAALTRAAARIGLTLSAAEALAMQWRIHRHRLQYVRGQTNCDADPNPDLAIVPLNDDSHTGRTPARGLPSLA
jgi:hypothetical protein